MNRDDIIRMAEEAGVPMEYSFVADATVWHLHPSFERFAKLIVYDFLSELTNDDSLGEARIATIKRLAEKWGVSR